MIEQDIMGPNIIKIKQVSNKGEYKSINGNATLKNLVYHVQECKGFVSLHKYFEHSQAIPNGKYLNYASQILNAIEDLNNHHIVHNDIRPRTLYINEETNIICIGGWDFACKCGSDTTSFNTLRMKYVNELFGITKSFLPSEFLIKDMKSTPDKSDIFSVGVVLYYMMNSKIPFVNATDPTYEKYLEETQPENSIPSLIKDMLKKDPFSRKSAATIKKDYCEMFTKF